MWPQYNRRMVEVVGVMSDEQLALRPSPERFPMWATVGQPPSDVIAAAEGTAVSPGFLVTPASYFV
jgi:hypothetical protein